MSQKSFSLFVWATDARFRASIVLSQSVCKILGWIFRFAKPSSGRSHAIFTCSIRIALYRYGEHPNSSRRKCSLSEARKQRVETKPEITIFKELSYLFYFKNLARQCTVWIESCLNEFESVWNIQIYINPGGPTSQRPLFLTPLTRAPLGTPSSSRRCPSHVATTFMHAFSKLSGLLGREREWCLMQGSQYR
jgi:hypothetical protein